MKRAHDKITIEINQVPDKIHKVSNLKRLATPPKDIDKQKLSKKNLDFLTDKKIE